MTGEMTKQHHITPTIHITKQTKHKQKQLTTHANTKNTNIINNTNHKQPTHT